VTSTIIPLVTVMLLIVSTIVADKLMHAVGYEPAGMEPVVLSMAVFFTIVVVLAAGGRVWQSLRDG